MNKKNQGKRPIDDIPREKGVGHPMGFFFKEAPGHGWDGQRVKSQHKESKGKDEMGN